MRESLAQIFERHRGPHGVDVGHGDKGTTHSYIEAYETLLAPYRDRCTFMEIGVASSYSMRMWGEYFGSQCQLWGVDLSFTFDTSTFDDRFLWFACDATKRGDFWPPERMFDVIIDDASHMEADQIATFELLRQRMNPGGIYIIEDILSPDESVHRIINRGHSSVQVYDFRSRKGRFDDMLIVFKF